MLEDLKRNDICVFADGSRESVRDVNDEGWRIQILFWKAARVSDEYQATIMGFSRKGVPLNISSPNPIVKVIKC